MEYAVYSDESYTSAARYSSICAVSFPRAFTDDVQNEIDAILKNSGVSEFKWQKLNDARSRFCAQKLNKYLFDNLFRKKIRVDVLIWDTQDSRHKIQGRDDIANFERMFFHLMKNLMKRREKDAHWHVYPDERMGIDWGTIKDCLSNAGKWRDYFESQLFGDAFSEQFYRIRSLEQVDPKKTPCCQIADLFAGMAVFSKNSYDDFDKWCRLESPQLSFLLPREEIECSNRERERFTVLKPFIEECKCLKLGVSIKTKKCLHTFDPVNPFNFWTYVPQHEYDKAPTRH